METNVLLQLMVVTAAQTVHALALVFIRYIVIILTERKSGLLCVCICWWWCQTKKGK
jgi:hypothetical protein